MLDKINVARIIVGHVDTLRDFSSERRSVADIAFFFGAPLIVSGLGWYLHWGLYVDALNALLAAFAIFAALLLNLLLLIYTFSADRTHPVTLARVRGALVRELHDNIAFATLTSLAIVVVALVSVAELKIQDPVNPKHTGPVMTFVIIYLTGNFILTVLMVLKRIHVLLSRELEQPSIRKVS